MEKTEAMKISDALVELGQSHSIVIGVKDGMNPRENYTVNVTPSLAYSPTDISALQRLGDKLGYGIAFIGGSFTFTKADL